MNLRTRNIMTYGKPLLTLLIALFLAAGPGQARAQTTAPDFDFTVTVTDGENSQDLVLGLDPAATDGYDQPPEGADQIIPPSPPAGAFDARITGTQNGSDDFLTDIRESAFGLFNFQLAYAASEGNGPIELSWDPNSLPGNVEATLVGGGGNFSKDMNTSSTLSIDEADGIGPSVNPNPISDGLFIQFNVIAPPDAPSDPSASATSSTEIDLSWTDNADDEDNFEVERSTDGGSSFSALATKSADATSHTDSGLEPNTEYCYRVSATNDAGSSAYTSDVCATTPKAQLGFTPGSISFALQTGSNTAQKTATVTASVTPGSAVSLSTDGNPSWLTVPSSATAGNAFALDADASGLSAGTYTATVTASATDYFDGTLNVTLTVSSLEAPSDLSASATSSTEIDLSWTDNADDEDNFEVERSTDGGSSFSALATKSADVISHTDSGLDPGTEYCYRVQATNANGGSGYTSTACATTSEVALGFTPSSLSLSLQKGSNTAQKTATVTASVTPDNDVSLATDADPSWLSVPSSAPAGSGFTLTADASGLDKGTYTATITASANETGYTDATLDVTLNVTPEVEINWTGLLEVTDANNKSITLEFGTGPDATENDDPNYDRSAPPPPPAGAFDARLTTNTNDFFADYRPPTTTDATVWTVEFQASTDGEPVTLDWSQSSFPEEGRFTLKDGTGSALADMRAKTSYTVTDGSKKLFIEHSLTSLVDQSVKEGWNLMGLPLEVDNTNYVTVYADVEPVQIPFGFDGTYTRQQELNLGVGYWIEFLEPGTQTIEGFEVTSKALQLQDGWNMIAGISCEIGLDEVIDPDGILTSSTLYAFDNAYEPSETIEADGVGYWIEASTAGEITLSCGSESPSGKTVASSAAKSPERSGQALTISDAAGASQQLYLGASDAAQKSYRLPPVPPKGAFDARFEDDSRLLDAPQGTIQLQGTSFPLRVALNGQASSKAPYTLEALAGGQVVATHTLSTDQAATLSNEDVSALRIKKAAELPEAFALQGNYPNPFNPSTTIALDLPEKAEVSVKVFDVLGRQVMTITAQELSAGTQSLRLDASSLNSGMYLYRVTARMDDGATKTATGRMTLVK